MVPVKLLWLLLIARTIRADASWRPARSWALALRGGSYDPLAEDHDPFRDLAKMDASKLDVELTTTPKYKPAKEKLLFGTVFTGVPYCIFASAALLLEHRNRPPPNWRCWSLLYDTQITYGSEHRNRAPLN
jgi:hypothetical protein